eukprot:1075877-Amphidinium_carterae.1
MLGHVTGQLSVALLGRLGVRRYAEPLRAVSAVQDSRLELWSCTVAAPKSSCPCWGGGWLCFEMRV